MWIPDAFGLRSEVNLYLGERDVVITPREYQRELMVV